MSTGTGQTTTGTTGQPAQEQAKQAAGTAADETKHVAGVAQGEAQKVAGDIKAHAHGLLGEATTQLEDQSRTQRDRVVDLLRTFGDDLDGMARDGQGGLAHDLATQVAQRARELSSRVDGREPRELLDDVRGFARRRPGTFLLGALAAGVVAGRVTRGARTSTTPSYDASRTGPGTTATVPPTTATTPGAAPATATDDAAGTATGDPLAGVAEADRLSTTPHPASSVQAGTTWTDRPGAGA